MTCDEYLRTVDDSHQMTTAKAHIAELCQVVAGQEWRILELGSHAGISAAAASRALTSSRITSLSTRPKCMTVLVRSSRTVSWPSSSRTLPRVRVGAAMAMT